MSFSQSGLNSILDPGSPMAQLDYTGVPRVPGRAVVPGQTETFPLVFLKDGEESFYYTCTMPNHHMHRQDGKRLAFVFGVLETRDCYDIRYMETEIAAKTPFIRKSTEEEVHSYRMRVDPKGAMRKALTPEIEAQVANELTGKLQTALLGRLTGLGIVLTPEQKAELLEDAPVSVATVTDDTAKLTAADVLARLRSDGVETIQSGTGVVSLQGIVGTDKLPNAAG